MNKSDGMGRFFFGMVGGVILGAVIDSMAIGILIGLVVGFGLMKAKRGAS
ncbi:MAG TPA: hypothetical protein VGA98_02590 [Allosphingosinicella sp.]|jgi:hypothetical protein